MDGRIVDQTRMRVGIARRMQESKQNAPHFYVQTEVIADGMIEGLGALSEKTGIRITVTAALTKACAETLRTHRKFNSVWTKSGLLEVDDINIGVAIALADGLVAPALTRADELSVPELAVALSELAERARGQRLRPHEISDATFTLSNLGMFDVSAFAAIITPPQVGILAVGRPQERWHLKDGRPTAARILTATLSADHRAVDGVDAARFVASFKSALETHWAMESASTKEIRQ